MHFLRDLLLSGDVRSLKDGLSGILFWGYYRVDYRDRRVKTFRDQVCDVHLQNASEIFPTLEGTGLALLKRISLPQFSNMAFITKLCTFLDPDHYCVLDRKLPVLRRSRFGSSARRPIFRSLHTMSDRTDGGWIAAWPLVHVFRSRFVPLTLKEDSSNL